MWRTALVIIGIPYTMYYGDDDFRSARRTIYTFINERRYRKLYWPLHSTQIAKGNQAYIMFSKFLI